MQIGIEGRVVGVGFASEYRHYRACYMLGLASCMQRMKPRWLEQRHLRAGIVRLRA